MPFIRRRPLLRMAAVGGVAYMGAKAGTNKAVQGPEAQQATPTPTPATSAAAPATDIISRLQQLAGLHESGALTDEEFASAKAQVLA